MICAYIFGLACAVRDVKQLSALIGIPLECTFRKSGDDSKLLDTFHDDQAFDGFKHAVIAQRCGPWACERTGAFGTTGS